LPKFAHTARADETEDEKTEDIRPESFKLQTSNFKLQTSNFKLQTSNFKLQTSNFKLPQHVNHPQSPIWNHRHRSPAWRYLEEPLCAGS
jgi:hypothetical protein